MTRTHPLNWPVDRHPALVYEHDPALGDYVFCGTSNSWTQRRAFANGAPLLLRGRGRRPTAAQISLFSEVDSRLPGMIEAAIGMIATIGRLPIVEPNNYAHSDLVLGEVRLEADGSVVFFFESAACDEHYVWPMVTLVDLLAKKAEWTV